MSDPSSAPSACPPKPAQMKKAASGKKPQKITQFKQLRGRPDEPLATRISKTLSYLLRHGAEKQALPMRQDGWLTVDDLCSHPSLTEHLSLASLQRIAAEDTKTRFALFYSRSTFDAPSLVPAKVEEGGGAWWIRANQGHSLALSGMEESMRKVETAEQAGLAVHGTTLDKWPLILENGLSKMTRQHIHLAISLPPSAHTLKEDDSSVSSLKITSGIRASSNILVYLDVSLLLAHHVPLFLSENDVLLSPGDPKTPGVLGREYFLRATKRNGEIVWERDAEIASAKEE